MRALPPDLRKQLETSVLAARRAAESASRAALAGLGVFTDRRPEHLDAAQAALRNGLRAKWRQLDHKRELLVAECAYEQWHRLLFARFLAENYLLLHPEFRAPVTLADCDDLADELGEPDGWSVAARFAAEILPGIFRLDDPCIRLRLAPEGRHALEQILDGLPPQVFAADDALGWVYQFWQKDKKDEVNASERKIGGADLGPVTQLFTENYMVRFLLENSLGAWWAARHPESPLVKGFEYLRFGDDELPAVGSFDGWPERVAEVTVMDPCCGSGHFLVEALSMLWQMRAEEEGLAPVDAQDAVLRDNLFGLELDARCVQIAMFAVALQAWKAGGGWRQLPVPNIACSGIPVRASVEEWRALADGDARLENALVRLHIMFRDADTFGSLIKPKRAAEVSDPTGLQASLDDVSWDEAAPLVERLAVLETADPATAVLGADAGALARAANLLSQQYTLVATNPPYLSKSKQVDDLRGYVETSWPDAVADLSLAVLLRLRDFTSGGATFLAVFPEKLLFLGAYRRARERLLHYDSWSLAAPLGSQAFSSPLFDLGILLAVWEKRRAAPMHDIVAVDATAARPFSAKAETLATAPLELIPQKLQLENPESRVVLKEVSSGVPLAHVADSYQGISSGDYARWGRSFWELPLPVQGWELQQTSVQKLTLYGGRENAFLWEDGKGAFYKFVCDRLGESGVGAWIRGLEAHTKRGVGISQMNELLPTLYDGDLFDSNIAVIVPRDERDVPALWAFCASGELAKEVRKLNRKVSISNKILLQVPFDVERWRKVAEDAGPLPDPWSGDPTQWLFSGRPAESTASLQVTVGRLVGYWWPGQSDSDDLDELADADGIVCLPSVAGEPPAADRLQQMLAKAFGQSWSPAKVKDLLEQAGSKRKNLNDWLRDEFFKHHCTLFGSRPFVWHISDGERDGFSALVNYHRLDRKTLEKLTYTYLGQDWVERQRAAARDEVSGAEARLAAALELQRKLEAILEGERPYDIYVRWKEPHEQPIGWQPDLNDGVRLNIRPFAKAGVLKAFSPWPFRDALWRKDRGKNPDRSERFNDIHLSLAEKREARRRAGRT
jgi:MmeI, DNA-methyltransferase domain